MTTEKEIQQDVELGERFYSVAVEPIQGKGYANVYGRDITEHKLAEEAIKASRQQLRTLARRLQSTREEQRKEIAREIHDELGGALTALKIDLSSLASSAPKSRDKTKRDSFLSKMLVMTKLIDETIGTVRKLVTELRPSILDDFGLLAALEWQLQEFQKRTGIQTEFVSTLEYIKQDEKLSIAVFRIFQEALTNVARHANATKVTATLYKEADSLLLKVEDNGKGISAADIHNTKSVGLIGMRERALFLGGTIAFSGEPSKGTTVSVQFPFES
jgi:signal transduction histidine kinase